MVWMTGTFLTNLAQKLLDGLVGKVSEDLYKIIIGDPVQRAYQKAIGETLQDFLKSRGIFLSTPLIKEESLLADPEVKEELAKILLMGEPNVRKIAHQWQTRLAYDAPLDQVEGEVRMFLALFEKNLRSTEAFRQVFEANDIHAIREIAPKNPQVLAEISEQIQGAHDLLENKLDQLISFFARAQPNLREQIKFENFYLEEKVRGFTGRKWVFDKIDSFLFEKYCGYFLIYGEAGIGKSALAAQYIKLNGLVHHFNILAENVVTPAQFLNNICAQLITVYQLGYPVLPANSAKDSSFLNRLLYEISNRLEDGQRCVIMVDALDESNLPLPGVNPLYLPVQLPKGIYFLVTSRNDPRYYSRIDCPQGQLTLNHDSPDNLADIRDYLKTMSRRRPLMEYMGRHTLTQDQFVKIMVEKSEGNFMYLRYVLPEIEAGAYQVTSSRELPQGLRNYYQDHWNRMRRGGSNDDWFTYKLPVILALTAIQEPVSMRLLKKFSQVQDERRIQEVLREWKPFLHTEKVQNKERGEEIRYRLYHSSFYNFIEDLQKEDHDVSLAAAHARITEAFDHDADFHDDLVEYEEGDLNNTDATDSAEE